MANEAKQFTIGGVTHDVMDAGARQLIADLQAAIDAITSGDTTAAIKTFQEVINFLDGVTDDETLAGKLNELRTLINDKVDKVYGYGLSKNDYTDAEKDKLGALPTKAQLDTEFGNKQNALTFDDTPTAGSNNPVKSGGIKQAIDALSLHKIITLHGSNGFVLDGETPPSADVFTLEHGKYYIIDGVEGGNGINNDFGLVFPEDTDTAHTYMGRLVLAPNVRISELQITLPATVIIPDEQAEKLAELENGHTYEFNIFANVFMISDITATE